ncbi:MAG: hypothetical protein LUF30_07665, partial [Lachnospiraceae bacterium]|nr:hypothetical protein [Lachnospiraceae bacterium]
TVYGIKYYLRKWSCQAGQMASGWMKISGKFYYFDTTTGVMWKNKTRGKYILGADGACTNR